MGFYDGHKGAIAGGSAQRSNLQGTHSEKAGQPVLRQELLKMGWEGTKRLFTFVGQLILTALSRLPFWEMRKVRTT